ncbi:MAG: PilZ domain-containing protein [Pseudomonadota bacterium]
MTEASAFKDRRRRKRVRLTMGVRFLLNADQEHSGELVDISASGFLLKSDAEVCIGDTVIAYVDELDRFVGRIVRVTSDGFAIAFDQTARREERLEEKLTGTAQTDSVAPMSARNAQRYTPEDTQSCCKFPGGEIVSCRVIDMSVSGVSVESAQRPRVGAEVQVGRMIGAVVRHTDTGFALAFKKSAASLPTLERDLNRNAASK